MFVVRFMTSMNRNSLLPILLLCPLLIQWATLSCNTQRQVVTTNSQVGSTEISRALAANSLIDLFDTILFTPATSPTEAPHNPATNPTVSVPFVITRHKAVHLSHHSTDTTRKHSHQQSTDTTFHSNIHSVTDIARVDSVATNFVRGTLVLFSLTAVGIFIIMLYKRRHP